MAKPSIRSALGLPRRLRLTGWSIAQIGCLPVLLLVIMGVIAMINLPAFWQLPGYGISSGALLAGRILASIVAITAVLMIAGWIVGLLGALVGARAAVGQGQLVRHRLTLWARRIQFFAWSVVLVRFGLVILISLLLTVFIAKLFPLAGVLGTRALILVSFYRLPVLVTVTGILSISYWLLMPLLRMNSSLALGVLAGSWGNDRFSRQWSASGIRLGLDLLGIVGVLWGGILLSLLFLLLVDPNYASSMQIQRPVLRLFPTLPLETAAWGGIMLGWCSFMIVHMAIQIILPSLYLRWGRMRLARKSRPPA